jgi:large subunit ribosomal protein L23
MDKQLILQPRLSEKTYGLSVVGNTYTFNVPGGANKHTVARAVAAQFDVTVENVNIVNVKGKAKRTVRKGGRAVMGQRSDVKKAYVTLKEGQSLPIFDVPEEDKKADKAGKETK